MMNLSDDGEAMHEWLFNQTPILATALDAEGILVAVSQGFAKRLGYTPEALAGRSLMELASERSARRITTEYQALLRRTGRVNNAVVILLHRDGQAIEFLTSTVACADQGPQTMHSISVYTEISDPDFILTKFRSIYRKTPAMLHTMDEHGQVLEASDRWLRRMGYTREEVVGRRMEHFLSQATRENLESGALKYIATADDYTNHPREMVTRGGEVLEVLHSAVHTESPTGDPLLLVASKDVTSLNRSQRQLREAFEENARLRRQLQRERDYLREEVHISMNFGQIIGSSPALQTLLERLDAVAHTSASVLIVGESGTGKELVAHAIHTRSPRAQRALVKVNCASIPHELFESEFFGHVKGAFTGAHRDREGRFKLADGGTIFLDEVGEIPLNLQSKLLRVLQEREFERVGDDETIKVDVRVIAATNRDLRKEVEAGRFREDLYYRLSVFPVDVPPLRDRGDDVIQLAAHFLEQICQDLGHPPVTLTQGQVDALKGYEWPGNVRELKSVLERAVILSRGGNIRLGRMGPLPQDPVREETPVAASEFVTDAQFRAQERDNLVAALEHAGWRISGPEGAAKLLGLKPSTLAHRIKTFGIEKPRAKRGRPRRQI